MVLISSDGLPESFAFRGAAATSRAYLQQALQFLYDLRILKVSGAFSW